jgi:hypothetical protein
MRTMFARGALGLLAVASAGVALALPTAFLGEPVDAPRRPAVPAEVEPAVIHVAAPPTRRPSRPAVTSARKTVPAPSASRPVRVPARPVSPQPSGPERPPRAEPQVGVYERPEPQAQPAPVLVAAVSSPEPVDGSAVRAARSVPVVPPPAPELEPASTSRPKTHKPKHEPKPQRPKHEPKPKHQPKPKHEPKRRHEPEPIDRSVPAPTSAPEPDAEGLEIEEGRPPHNQPKDRPDGGKPERDKPDKG